MVEGALTRAPSTRRDRLSVVTATIEYLSHLAADGAGFAAALERADRAASVPCCPDWEARDLLAHLTRVHWFWNEIVTRRAAHPDETDDEFEPAPSDEALLAQYREGLDVLVETLRRTDPDVPVWTWDENGTTVAWVRRRQAHEALIHRVDAEQTAGTVGPIDRTLAADGVDEVLRVAIAGVPSWGEFTPDGATLRLARTDGDGHWGVAFGRFTGTSRSGREYDLDACTVGMDAADPDALIEGSAAALDLWLWGREPVEKLTVTGDRSLAGRLRSLAAEATQ